MWTADKTLCCEYIKMFSKFNYPWFNDISVQTLYRRDDCMTRYLQISAIKLINKDYGCFLYDFSANTNVYKLENIQN